MKKISLRSRRFKHGSMAMVVTVGFLAALVLLNVVVGLLLQRFPLTIDLTKENRFSLTEESIDFLKTLEQDVNITILAEESELDLIASQEVGVTGNFYKQAHEIIKNYAKYSDCITLDYVNLIKNPTFAKKYTEKNIELNNYDVIIECGDRVQTLSMGTDLVKASSTQYGGTSYSSQAEQKMTSAIMFVTDQNPITVGIISGADSVDVSGYTELLKANSYEVQTIDFLTEAIDPNLSFLILPQPIADLTAEQVKKLETYLDNDGKFGKGLVFVASNNRTIPPLLKGFLAEWGVEIGDGIVYETDSSKMMMTYFGPDPYTVLNEVADQDVRTEMAGADLNVVVPMSRPVNTLFEASDNRETRVITHSSGGTILVPFDVDETFDVEAQVKQPFNSMVLSTRAKFEGLDRMVSSVLTVGSPDMLASNLLQNGNYANNSLTLAATGTFAEKKSTVQILPVNVTPTSISITAQQINLYFILLVVAVPILVLVASLVVWLRRRHL